MIIPIELRFKADKDSKSALRTEKTIKSHDVNSIEFHISIEGLELTDSHTAKILSVFHTSESQANMDCEIVEGKIIYKPDTNLISRHEHVTNYVYVYHNNQSLDVREFIYVVDLSKIDETSLEVKEVYDQSYADLLADFEQALSDYKDNLPQADSVRADIDEILNQFSEDSQAKLSRYDTDAQQVITDNQTAFNLAESVRQEDFDTSQSERQQQFDSAQTARQDSYEQTQSLINEAEESRVQAEGQRESAESNRVQSEAQRVTQEQTRQNSEAVRAQAEQERVQGYQEIQQIIADGALNAEPADGSLTTEKYANESVTAEKTNFFKVGKNLFNKHTTDKNKLVSYTKGNLVDNPGYETSAFIPLPPNASKIVQSHKLAYAFYDERKQDGFIIGSPNGSPISEPRVIEIPAGARYLRASITTGFEGYQIEVGEVSTAYEEYKRKIDYLETDRNNLSPTLRNELDNVGQIGGLVEDNSNMIMRIANKVPIYENETTSGGTGVEQSNTSTFSGWGSPVGIRKNFNTVEFFVNAWDITKPITEVRVVVKENSYDGAVLADKTTSVSVPTGILSRVTVRLDNEVENDSSVPLWVEYHTNGRTGYLPINPTSYPNTTYPKLRYSTRSSVTNMTMVETSSNLNIYYEFKKFVGDKLKPSKEFSEGFSINQDAYETDHYGKWNLKNFVTQASSYESELFDERLEVAIIGDSWVRTTHRVTGPIRKKLNKDYGNGGIGFVGFTEIRLANGETQISTTGTWVAINHEKGLDMRQYQSTVVGSTIELTTYEPSDRIEIHHLQQVGSYRYRVNGGAWVTVDTSTSTFVADSSFVQGNVTLEIEVLSGTVTLLNAYLFNGDRGAVVHQWGYGGATAGHFANIDRNHFIAEFRKTNIKSVGIVLGTNDMAQNVPLDTFKANISEVVSRIKEANPLTDIFLIAPSGNNLTRTYTMKEYDDALLEVAKKENIAYVSLFKTMGTFEEQNARGLFEDDVHPNAKGGRVIGSVVYDRLLRL